MVKLTVISERERYRVGADSLWASKRRRKWQISKSSTATILSQWKLFRAFPVNLPMPAGGPSEEDRRRVLECLGYLADVNGEIRRMARLQLDILQQAIYGERLKRGDGVSPDAEDPPANG
jgi:hypothetical protein